MKENIRKLNEQLENTLKDVTRHLADQAEDGGKISVEKMDENQYVHYNLAWHTAESYISNYFEQHAFEASTGSGEFEQHLAYMFAGEAFNKLRGELAGRQAEYGISDQALSDLFSADNNKLVQDACAHNRYNQIADQVLDGNYGAHGLTEDHLMMRDTFRQFAEEKVMPHAEHIHRNDEDLPQEIIDGLVELGAFGITIPGQYGGYLDDYGNQGMMVVTEELSRGGLAIAGSLITRPEILSKALLKGGTDAQKEKWLPMLAAGERMNCVAVTEPNYGSDVAGMKVGAKKTDGGWLINGVKTWCTFAGYADIIMVLARTEDDPTHRGMSILMAEKPRFNGHKFSHKQDGGGSIEGGAIATIGYRGMHSFEVNFDNYFVPDENLIGGEEGRGKGFYMQMAGFAGGRVQTAARACGVMQAAMEAGARYANERKVFGKEIGRYQLTKWKLARMAMITQATRQYGLHVARLMDEGKGNMEATLVKFYGSRISEWVTREAMQIHGGMGYAEEYPVSRYFVDARVFSIFEGAEEVMALRVCARDLLNQVIPVSK